MSTAPSFGWGDAALGGISSIGSMINSYYNYRNTVDQARFQTRTLGERLAMEMRNLQSRIAVAQANNAAMVRAANANASRLIASIMEQERLVNAERGRQQQYARGQRDAVDANIGLFKDFNGQMGAKAGAITDAIMELINANPAPDNAPAASGAVADREAALMAQTSAEVAGDVQRGANLESMDQVMGDIGVASGRNNQIADLLGNFAQGSAAVLDPALRAAQMVWEEKPIFQNYVRQERYIEPVFKPRTSYTGDMLQLGANLAGMFGLGDWINRKTQPSPYSLMGGNESLTPFGGLRTPRGPNLDYMGGGLGALLPRAPSLPDMGGGTGVRLFGNTGLVLGDNLGIK